MVASQPEISSRSEIDTAFVGNDVENGSGRYRRLDLPPLRHPEADSFLSPRDTFATRLTNVLLQPLSALLMHAFNRKLAKSRKAQIELLKTAGGKPVEIEMWYGIPDIPRIRPEEELDFLEHRSPMYVPRLTRGVVAQLARWITGHQRLELASDETLTQMVFWTVIGHSFEERVIDGEPCFVFDVSEQRKVATSPRATFDVNWIAVGIEPKDGKHKLLIEMVDGVCYDPTHPKWDLAKFYFQIAWAYSVVGMVHTWVHFAFPNVSAAVLENLVLEGKIDRNGNLYKLAFPHVRFTMWINNQALHESRFSPRKEPSFKSKFAPWHSLPLDSDTFGRNIARLTNRFYFQRPDGSSVFPPRFDERKPYDLFTREYWQEVRRFTGKVADAIDDAEFAAFAEGLGAYLPDAKTAERADLLGSLIWWGGILHSADHYSAYRYAHHGVPMAKKHFDPSSNDKPEDLVSGWNLMRWRNSTSTFIGNLADDALDVSTRNVDYGFADPQLQGHNVVFRERLAQLDQRLEAEGRQISPLRYMVLSICY